MVVGAAARFGARSAISAGRSLRTMAAVQPRAATAVWMVSKRSMSTHFAESHEYIKVEGQNVGRVGITDFAAEALGDIVHVELPEVGDIYEKGAIFGSVESVKAASDVYLPVDGEIVEVNEKLSDTPDLVNSAAMGDAWFVKIKSLSLAADAAELMDEAAYAEHIKN